MYVGFVRIEHDERSSTLRSIDLGGSQGSENKREIENESDLFNLLVDRGRKSLHFKRGAAVLRRFVRIMKRIFTENETDQSTPNIECFSNGQRVTKGQGDQVPKKLG